MASISVLMPVLNAEKYVSEAIQSILNQSFSDFELIVIDDGSVDQTIELVSNFKDPRIRFYKHNKNLGLVATLNWGLSLAVSPIVARMDADDISALNRFEIQYDFLSRNPDVGLVGSWIEGFGEIKRKYIHKYPINHDDIVALMIFSNPIAHPSVMFRKKIFEKLDCAYANKYAWVEDWELWWRFKGVTRLANIPKPLLRYRINKNSVNHRHAEKQHQSKLELINHFLSQLSIREPFAEKYISQPKSLTNCIEQEFFLKKILESNLKNLQFSQDSLERHVNQFFYANCLSAGHQRWLLATYYVSSPLVKNSSLVKIGSFFRIICGFYARQIFSFWIKKLQRKS
jgi:glycosyltransferase involved in cell wall biosynthesis